MSDFIIPPMTSLPLNLHPGLQVLHLPAGNVWIQRDDLIHPIVSGNKWRKLTGHLNQMSSEGKRILITFGGAYSNHLVATAVAAQAASLRCIGVLRGEEEMKNHYLDIASGAGMELHGVSRTLYRDKAAALEQVLSKLDLSPEDVFVVAEGGSGPLGLLGFKDLVDDWQKTGKRIEHVFHASATGTTAVGLRKALDQSTINDKALNEVAVYSILVLKNSTEQLEFAQRHNVELSMVEGYEFGGYAKSNQALNDFVQSVSIRNSIAFEPIYTGKALFALNDWLIAQKESDALELDKESGVFPVVFLHTGGTLNYSGVTLPVIES
ncbi:MAG: pyridoxal-phosphate dependent enzyme [Bacteroidetes bacterium]|nr:pyridoxal-phosphate dependent enzyme [Bacteroidota bacterium]MDA1224767.1 pyridoxal-phosphate dependent enzyme [Bacteroidota bacterium]